MMIRLLTLSLLFHCFIHSAISEEKPGSNPIPLPHETSDIPNDENVTWAPSTLIA